MEVILLENVANLGSVGEVVRVKAGFARNFLIPFEKAMRATKANLVEVEARRAELEKKAADSLSAAQKRAEAVEALSLVITARASEEGKLYGSVSARDVADACTAAGVHVEKSEVNMPDGAIHEIGEFVVHAKLHSEVTATVKLAVEAEQQA